MLKDEIKIRRLTYLDIDIYEKHLLSLDHNSRYERFEAALDDSAVLRYSRWLLIDDYSYLYGAFDGENLCGVGEFRISGTEAEIAISVDSAYRKRGIATLLFDKLKQCARENGISVLQFVTLPSNYGVRRIARKNRIILRYEGSTIIGRLEVG